MSLLILMVLYFSSCSYSQRNPSSSKGSVLYIGDSQSAGFLGGLVFDHFSNSFKEGNIQVYGVGSSSPRHWADAVNGSSGSWLCDDKRKGRFNRNYQISLKSRICKVSGNETIYGKLNRNKPDYVVFQFLGNSMNQSNEKIKTNIGSLLSNLGNQECLFVTSPPFYDAQINSSKTDLTELETKYKNLMIKNEHRLVTENRIIRAVGNRCKIVSGMKGQSMTKFSQNRANYGKDAIHLSPIGAKNFLDHFKSELP